MPRGTGANVSTKSPFTSVAAMLMPRCLLASVLAPALILFAAPLASSAARPAVVLNKPGGSIKPGDVVSGRLTTPGLPVVLMRKDADGSAWHVQLPVEWTGRDTFATPPRFDDLKLADGERVRFIAIVLRDAEAAKVLETGTTLEALPREVAASTEVTAIFRDPEAKHRDPRVSLLDLENNMPVDRQLTVQGSFSGPGKPLVLVQPQSTGAEWVVYEPVVSLKEGEFQCDVHLADDETPHGSRFHIIAALASATTARRLKEGARIRNLPADLPRSEAITLIFEPEQASEQSPAVTLFLTPNMLVARQHTIQGRIAAPGRPLLFIRGEGSGDLWWVHVPDELRPDGVFELTASFGGDKTAPGEKFRIVPGLARTAEEAARFTHGQTLDDLPEDFPLGKPVIVVRAK